ncbi:MAG: DUF4389 domain-containing protein [Acidimicrobiales bacterium]
MEPSTPSYPVSFTFVTSERIARWRPLVAWLLVIPHLFVLYGLQIVASILIFLSWFAIVFTGKQPEAFVGFPMLLLRYQDRVMTYSLFLQEEYPPFTFDTTGTDPGDYPRMRVDTTPAMTDRNRLTVFFRYFMLIPQVVVLLLVGLAVAVVVTVAWFAVIILGRWPDGMREFVLGYVRWTTRVNGYAFLLTDEYPPFSTR